MVYIHVIFLLVEADVFNKFMDHQGKFDESLITNLQGLLSLYEAAHFRVHVEEILEEALKFTTTYLDSSLTHVSNYMFGKVSKALEMPVHKTLIRLGSINFLSIYQQDESHDDILLNFAKLDFNLLQKMYKKELSDITSVRMYVVGCDVALESRDTSTFIDCCKRS
ncbi:(-)-germacrene D synthase [Olea europaea subsp. europaea]|uniref:(-)-germacrene D synthase n=1 Tax=Olea europaea subsp. europaea TaxID=158383 RepID=A0A8S0UY63_OLEEU|nr:(-)-germacrene D synthase [Olea europaea subsp. europaea]